jgi:hypothetical protein
MRASVTVTVASARSSAPAARQPIDLERLLHWTYAMQKAHLVADQGRGLLELEAHLDGVAAQGGSSALAVARVLSLGTIVDTSAPDPGRLHPDAEAVHRQVQQLPGASHGLPLSRLLLQHGRDRDRPDCMAGVVSRPQAVLTVRGRVQTEWTDAGRRCGYCPIVYEPSATRIRQAREEYAAWHAGLVRLAALLRPVRLAAWLPLPPRAPAQPWLA